MTISEVKSMQGNIVIQTGNGTNVYYEITDEGRYFNVQKMEKKFYSTLNDDMALLELLKSLSPNRKQKAIN